MSRVGWSPLLLRVHLVVAALASRFPPRFSLQGCGVHRAMASGRALIHSHAQTSSAGEARAPHALALDDLSTTPPRRALLEAKKGRGAATTRDWAPIAPGLCE